MPTITGGRLGKAAVLIASFDIEAGVLVGVHLDPLGVDGQSVQSGRLEKLLGVIGFEQDHVLADLDFMLARPRRSVRGRYANLPFEHTRSASS